jgi:hypothetical protein
MKGRKTMSFRILLGQEVEQPSSQEISLAELSRQHLSGEMSTKEYLWRERQLLPRSRQYPLYLEKMLRELAGELVADEIARQSRFSPAP